MKKVNVIGGGLAESEASLYLAQRGIEVDLYEMRPKKETGAHKTSDFAEFVCSNSLGATDVTSASGLLKEEMKMLGGTLINVAFEHSVPSGNSLSIDRFGFSEYITKLIRENENINIINEEYEKIDVETPTIIATGPLTSNILSDEIKKLTGEENFHFYDAIAPIVEKDSINFDKAFYASRWQKGEPDFINCPMQKEEYDKFYEFLVNAETIELKGFEAKYFEGCMPVEAIAKRGYDTLRFGPMKPVGIRDERDFDKKYYAIVQLRQDNKQGNLYNLVGFQTNLKWGEQKKLLELIPGLESAKIVRYGVMHANSFINSPKILNPTLQTKRYKNLFFAGQITGVEGYNESMATGLLTGVNMYKYLNGEDMLNLPDVTMLGALTQYITYPHHKNFQPINSNWGIVKECDLDRKLRKNKEIKNKFLADRAINYYKENIL